MHGSRRWSLVALGTGCAVALLLLHACQEPPPPTEPELAVVATKTLTVLGAGTGDGVVTSSPAGVNCTITAGKPGTTGCVVAFDRTLTVTLTATPKSGHAFQGWAKYCVGFDPCVVPMSANRTVQARFAKGPFTVKITSGVSGVGRGTVRSQAGLTPAINCTITNGQPASTGCSAKYPAHTRLVLTATPASGNVFNGWGGVCGGDGTCQYEVTKAISIPATFLPASSPAAAAEGRWLPTFQTPSVAVHMNLLPSGKVIVWGKKGQTYLWDPANAGAGFQTVSKTYQLFCGGHTLLEDGRLFVAGGHISTDRGLPQVAIFDPGSGVWTPTASMRQGRWYPTLTTLPNGEILTVAGADEGGAMVPVPEVWGPGGWRRLTGASLTLPYYPAMFVAPNGHVFMAGPGRTTRYLETDGSGRWTSVADRIHGNRDYGSAVMYAPGKILYAGGGDPPTGTAEVIDLNVSSPSWRAVPSMTFARRQMMATLLADGQVLVTHGTSGSGFNDVASAVRYAELWNPATERWSTMAREAVPRAYHSTALLLPDGRVLSSGSGETEGVTFANSELSAQIFTPPYLFDAEGRPAVRPGISSAPTRLSYGQSFTVRSPDAASVSRGTLIRLSSVTHAFNQSQLIYPLSFGLAGAEALAGQAPPDARAAPPGPYMLFLVNRAGVPSLAAMVTIER